MSILIPMDEAARILGMTVEQVSELRSDNEIFGYCLLYTSDAADE